MPTATGTGGASGTGGGESGAPATGGGLNEGAAEGDALPLHPGEDGWLSGDENALGLQGAFYAFSSTDSRVELSTADGKLCMTGQAAQVLDENYGTYWGAGVGFDVCATGAEDDPPETKYTLGTCPFGERLDEITGRTRA